MIMQYFACYWTGNAASVISYLPITEIMCTMKHYSTALVLLYILTPYVLSASVLFIYQFANYKKLNIFFKVLPHAIFADVMFNIVLSIFHESDFTQLAKHAPKLYTWISVAILFAIIFMWARIVFKKARINKKAL